MQLSFWTQYLCAPMTFTLILSLSYESFTKGPLTWQDNASPYAGATITSSKGGAKAQEKTSAQHRAKGTALDTASIQITVFAGGGTSLPSTWDMGEEGLRGCCSSSGPAGGKGLGCPVPQAEEDDSVRKSLRAYRSNPWMTSSNGKTAMKISSVMLMDTFLKVHLKKLRNVILGALIVTNLKHDLGATEQPWQETENDPLSLLHTGDLGCFAK